MGDVEFVLTEVVRFAQMPLDEVRALGWRETLATLPHPSGQGSLICGRQAARRLRGMAENFLARSPHAGRVDLERYLGELKRTVSCRFLGEGRPVDISQVTRALSSALRSAARSCEDMTHYVPCHLATVEAPDEVVVGPVMFRPRRLVMERLRPELEEKAREQQEMFGRSYPTLARFASSPPDQIAATAERDGRLMADAALAYFEDHLWVAEVTIRVCDHPTSTRRAELAVEAAINVLRVFLGEDQSDRFRMGGTPASPEQQAGLTRGSDGKLLIGLSRQWAGQALGETWWSVITEGHGPERLAAAGQVLAALADGTAHFPLCERLVDAFSWYGQAVVDPLPAARIVKYMNAVERITVCGQTEKVTDTVAARAGALCWYPDGEMLDEWRDRIRAAYDMRSKLVHGTWSPFDPRLEAASWSAERVARLTLIRGLDCFSHLDLSTPEASSSRLAAALDKMVEHVEGLAVETATVS